jgi:peroxiredoxin
MAAIEAAQQAAWARYREAVAKDSSEDAVRPLAERFRVEAQRNVDAALHLAREAPDDPASADALKFVIRTNRAGPGPASAEALRLMIERRRFTDRDVKDILPHIALLLFQYPDAESFLRQVIDENTHHDDRGLACYWLATHYQQQARMARMFREKPGQIKGYEKYTAAEPIGDFVKRADPEALDRKREALLARILKEFGDVVLDDDTRPLAECVKGELFALRKLNVGQPAPEIEGTDADGKPFKLSETRGKVVVLTFSGNWCGPCVGMYPEERALVARHKDRPFALVSVNTDAELTALKTAIDRGEITWRCWWDGGRDGTITTRWGVASFPTIFVLDRTGVIRFKDVRGKELDAAVDRLLAEPE